VMWVCIAQR